MTKKILIAAAAILIASALFLTSRGKPEEQKYEAPLPQERTWEIKSIDTMKYSRDLSLEKLNDPSFDLTINEQVEAIRDLNATHVAIGTPYDERFIPILKRWVKSARNHKLQVWYRGNFSGWQGWFGVPKDLTREQHIELTRDFIRSNPDLFQNGDVFNPCPECENGGPGDPRHQTSVDAYRKFLIDERNAALEEFKNIGKDVKVVDSMNFDVAKLIMNRETAQAMGSVIVIDHYVKTPQRLEADVQKLAKDTGAKILLGEFGVPIPDIHGNLTKEQQADWIQEALTLLKDEEELIGLNYWVNVGGSTTIFEKDNTPRPAANVLKNFFSLTTLD